MNLISDDCIKKSMSQSITVTVYLYSYYDVQKFWLTKLLDQTSNLGVIFWFFKRKPLLNIIFFTILFYIKLIASTGWPTSHFTFWKLNNFFSINTFLFLLSE